MFDRSSSPRRWYLAVVLAALCATGSARPEAVPSARDIFKGAGVEAGLCVQLGGSDPALTANLTNGGRMLVHALALDEAAAAAVRKHLQAKGLYGLATVERAATLQPLPYADNLVNLLVADLSALGGRAPSAEEIQRVLVPGGVAYLRRDGKWTRTVKPRPAEMDEWTHFDYGPEGNGVSHDRLVKCPTFLQWICGVQEIQLGGNPAAFHVYTGVRSAGGRVFFGWGTHEKNKSLSYYSGRDAFNGLQLWNVSNPNSFGRDEHQFVAVGERVYTYPEWNKHLVALDAASGKVAQTFDQGGTWGRQPGQSAIRHAGSVLLQTDGTTLYALDPGGGAVKWKHQEKGALLFPSAAPRDDKVFVAVGPEVQRGSSRWPVTKAQEILCLELSSGKELWRNGEVAGRQIGQLIYDDSHLAVFGSGAIGGGTVPCIGLIRAGDGKLLWNTTFQTRYNRFGYNMLVRDGVLYYADAWRIYAVNRKDGQETRPYELGSYNQRCNRFCATEDLLIFGLVTYVDKEFRGNIQSISRSGCAQGAVPANGLLYFTPNACHCISELRGHVALSPEPVRQPLPDGQRLVKGDNLKQELPPRAEGSPTGPIYEDWAWQERVKRQEPAAVTADGKTFVSLPHQHRLECRDADGKMRWAFTAGGRITSAPLLHEGLCLFGCHDGRVYCLKADDGALVWRLLAAPYERRLIAYGQLESSWPVYGVTLHQGLACCSAGLHPEVGGGIYVYGLELATGKQAWQRVLRKSPQVYQGQRQFKAEPNRILNDVLQSDGKLLSLPGIAFAPDEPEAQLQAKVDNPSKSGKRP